MREAVERPIGDDARKGGRAGRQRRDRGEALRFDAEPSRLPKPVRGARLRAQTTRRGDRNARSGAFAALFGHAADRRSGAMLFGAPPTIEARRPGADSNVGPFCVGRRATRFATVERWFRSGERQVWIIPNRSC